MTVDSLNAHTRKELAQQARRKGIAGWHGMRKRELVEALLNVGRTKNGVHPKRAKSAPRRSPFRLRTHAADCVTTVRDRLDVEVVDSHWLRVSWALSPRMLARAEASLGPEWHAAIPVIRVVDVTGDDRGSEQTQCVKDVEITGGAETWYVPVDDLTRTYCLHIGYLAQGGQFFSLAHSRKVQLPKPGSSSRMQRPGSVSRKSGRVPMPSSVRNGNGRPFEIEAELVLHGSTEPRAQLTLLGEPVELDEDGHFSLRVSLPEGRQVIPAVSVTPGGDEQRTIVLAVERNTKRLEPESLVEV